LLQEGALEVIPKAVLTVVAELTDADDCMEEREGDLSRIVWNSVGDRDLCEAVDPKLVGDRDR